MGASHSTPGVGSGKVVAALINARGVSDTTPAMNMRLRRKLPPISIREDARSWGDLRALSMRFVCPHENYLLGFQLHGDGLNVFSFFCTYSCSCSWRSFTITSTTTPLPPCGHSPLA